MDTKIAIDSSALVESLTGYQRARPRMERFFADGVQLVLSALVLYEWWRGPRTPEDLSTQQRLFPAETCLPFLHSEARVAAGLYRRLSRARGREMDIAIAATAIANELPLWTLNKTDFADIPGLKLVD